MADVFVSYARSDKARVAPLVAAIEANGWSVWWDPEITPGQEFDDEIDAEIGVERRRRVLECLGDIAEQVRRNLLGGGIDAAEEQLGPLGRHIGNTAE